ncbi:MAG TPA: DUF2515 family protein [Bacillales bacterium]|nr:DUF2515 family protein [Bacillales bacterium]
MKNKLPSVPPPLSEEEKQLIFAIKQQTRKYNQNNVTRTAAYFQFYIRHPEIHWALLGHMVSRNGGWSMTDLKGELLTKLLPKRDQRAFYLFLERGNWLIFQDVYPQFLLYEQSLKTRREMFDLLPCFHVSTFIETLWRYFWNTEDRYTLAIATVINEQSYLEQRVIQHDHFKKTVTATVGFKLYDFLRFNNILFPYYGDGNEQRALLIGDTLRHFTSLHHRILLGKRLYKLLFRHENILQGVLKWAQNHPHTGSRKDYWPDVFNDVKESDPRSLYIPRVKNCKLRKGADRLYSPPLKYAWPNMHHEAAEIKDWFSDWHIMDYLKDEEVDIDGKVFGEYCKTLEKIELAVMAKEAVLLRDGE